MTFGLALDFRGCCAKTPKRSIRARKFQIGLERLSGCTHSGIAVRCGWGFRVVRGRLWALWLGLSCNTVCLW